MLTDKYIVLSGLIKCIKVHIKGLLIISFSPLVQYKYYYDYTLRV